jgi:hypothetical protein
MAVRNLRDFQALDPFRLPASNLRWEQMNRFVLATVPICYTRRRLLYIDGSISCRVKTAE